MSENCSAVDDGDVCVLAKGHVGAHDDGRGSTWTRYPLPGERLTTAPTLPPALAAKVAELRRLLSEATPGPWQQGVLLSTPQTRQYTLAEVQEASAREKSMVLCNFTSADQGRSRELVANTRNPADAILIAYAISSLPALLDALESAATALRESARDGERLDWLEKSMHVAFTDAGEPHYSFFCPMFDTQPTDDKYIEVTIRNAIDSAISATASEGPADGR
jgi:hypothetical protein